LWRAVMAGEAKDEDGESRAPAAAGVLMAAAGAGNAAMRDRRLNMAGWSVVG